MNESNTDPIKAAVIGWYLNGAEPELIAELSELPLYLVVAIIEQYKQGKGWEIKKSKD